MKTGGSGQLFTPWDENHLITLFADSQATEHSFAALLHYAYIMLKQCDNQILPTGVFCAQDIKSNTFSFCLQRFNRRDKVNVDILWLPDESLDDSAGLPEPRVLALEITENLEAVLEQFATITEDLKTPA